MKRKFLSILLTAIMITGTFGNSMVASAEASQNEPAEIQDYYIYDEVTYYNVNSKYLTSSPQLFIQDCLTSTNDDYLNVADLALADSQSTANLWLPLALPVQQQLGTSTKTSKFRTQFNDVLARYLAGYSLGKSASLTSGGNTYLVTSSGLQYASSVSSAGAAIESAIYKGYTSAKGSRDMYHTKASKSGVLKNTTLSSNSESQEVFWTLLSAHKTSGTYKKGHYQAVAVIFSNFTLSPILPEDTGNNYITYSEDPVTTTLFTSGVKNESSEPVNATQTLSQSTSEEVINEITGSRDFTFGQIIGTDIHFSMADLSLEASFEEIVHKGWSETSATGTYKEQTSEVSITIPAYTATMIASDKTTWTSSTNYNCPVALGYDVTIVEYTLDPSSNSAEASTKILASYKNVARTKLYQYAVTELNTKSSDNMNWSSTSSAVQAAAKTLATTAPMSGTGASMNIESEVIATRINDFSPIYPLTDVKSVDNIKELNLSLAEYIYLDEIDLEGYNSRGGIYYGFDDAKGSWVLVNESNEEIGNGTSESAAILQTDSVTGEITLNAQSAGTVYLKYKINEDCYATSSDAASFATNNTISTTILKINVSSKMNLTTPTIEAQSEDLVITSTKDSLLKDIKALNLSSGLTDSENDVIVSYVLYDIVSEEIIPGTRLYPNSVSALTPGTYYVRAKVGNHYSAYVTVNLVDNKLTTLTIPSTLTIEEGSPLQLFGLYIQGYDQNNQPLDVSNVTWHCDSDKASIKDDFVTFENSGTFSVYAISDGVESNEMLVTVLQMPEEEEENTPEAEDTDKEEPLSENENTENEDTTKETPLSESDSTSPEQPEESSENKAAPTGDASTASIWCVLLLLSMLLICKTRFRHSFGK